MMDNSVTIDQNENNMITLFPNSPKLLFEGLFYVDIFDVAKLLQVSKSKSYRIICRELKEENEKITFRGKDFFSLNFCFKLLNYRRIKE